MLPKKYYFQPFQRVLLTYKDLFIYPKAFTITFNPRPPEVFFVTRHPKGVVATLDLLYGTPDTPIFATSV